MPLVNPVQKLGDYYTRYHVGNTIRGLSFKWQQSVYAPSLFEIFCIVVLGFILYLLFFLFHYNSIESEVQKNSRCALQRRKGRYMGKYVVTAKDSNNKDIYRVSYDFNKKEVKAECACKQGSTQNTMYDIPLYNIRTNSLGTIKEKTCFCEDYHMDKNMYYSGYPGLIGFMNSGGKDLSFFENAAANQV